MRIEEVARETDTSRLWRTLLAAKADGDQALVRAVEGRMRELAGERRFVHLSDDELDRRIAGLRGNREPEGMLGHSPDGSGLGGPGGGFDTRHTTAMNEAMRRDQHVGLEATLAALLDERERRREGGRS